MKQEYWINVKHVDNRMVVFLNGVTIWDSGIVHGDPELNKFINITEELSSQSSHTSELIFEGFNDTYNPDDNKEELNPWHFNYRVIERTINSAGQVIKEENILAPYNERHLSNPNTRVINNCYQLKGTSTGVKVISNTLSQHFYN